jgi:hypothetical protein
MLKKVVKTYYKLLDEKLENGTMVVLIIALLIIAISFFIRNSESNLFLKSNLLESNKIISYNINKDNFIDINWIKYKIILKETNSEK